MAAANRTWSSITNLFSKKGLLQLAQECGLSTQVQSMESKRMSVRLKYNYVDTLPQPNILCSTDTVKEHTAKTDELGVPPNDHRLS